MKKLACFLIAALSLFGSAYAAEESEPLGFWIEAQASNRSPSGELVVYWDRYVTETVGVYALAVKDSSGFREAYVGPKFRLAEGVEVGIGLGREAPEKATVKNLWLSIDAGRVAFYGTLEKGSITWHKETLMYKAGSWNVGLMHETGLGIGPRAEWNFADGWQAWVAVLRKDGTSTAKLAVNHSF